MGLGGDLDLDLDDQHMAREQKKTIVDKISAGGVDEDAEDELDEDVSGERTENWRGVCVMLCCVVCCVVT